MSSASDSATFLPMKTYFLSDAHLGSLAFSDSREKERILVSFLDSIKHEATAIYLLGDMFDFWHEWSEVVPKGYTRFLGKLSELTDLGVEVHYFLGNHDIWAYGYLHDECGVTLHTSPATVSFPSATVYMAHGDGLGDPSATFRFLRGVFHSGVLQWLFRTFIPTSWAMRFGLSWARHSRLKERDESYKGEHDEPLVQFAKTYLKEHPEVNLFVFGHRHIELDLMLSRTSRLVVLGDCYSHFTYGVLDDKGFRLDNYA